MLATEVKKIDPRTVRTLKSLRAALGELLAEKEFSKITVQDITERAGVNRATFYDRFTDKYALLNDSVREEFETRLASRLPEAPLLTMDNLRILTLTVCEFLGGFMGHCAPTGQRDDRFLMVRQVQFSMSDAVLAWANRSVLPGGRSPISPETIATVSSFAIFGAVLEWTQNGRKLSQERLTEQVVTLLATGVGVYLVAPA
jgi:AcrR family transcriptional regulator